MLLICPVRPGDENPELRYALRSWETNLILDGGLDLVTVGHKPDWLQPDNHIEGNRYSSAPAAVFDNILLASQQFLVHPDIAVYMNDDFYCMDPVGAVLPVKRNCSLDHHIAQFPANASTWWPISLRLTASWLAEQGIPRPDSYEVHRPILASPRAMYETLSLWEGGMNGPLPQWRTMYGALNHIKAYPVVDAKLGMRATGFGTPWVSTSDQSWRRYMSSIAGRFQKPSRWER